MFYETFDIGVQPEERLSKTWYYYDLGSGNVTRVVTREEGSQTYTATRMEYARNGRTVTFVLGESWTWDGEATSTSDYAVLYARHFRYDSGRARYLNREYNPAAVQNGQFTDYTNVWTDYAGDAAYGDFTISGGQAVNTAAWAPGIGQVTGLNGSPVTRYHHGDHLGTLRLMSDDVGAGDGHRVWTAFGEALSGPTPPDRYGYVGAHGYQAHEEFPFLHVGARYYDPASGRFFQRTSIAAMQLVEYAGSGPKRRGGDIRINNYRFRESRVSEHVDATMPHFDVTKDGKKVGEFWADGSIKRVRNRNKMKIAERIARKAGIFLAVACFAYDWYQDDFSTAVENQLWPLPQILPYLPSPPDARYGPLHCFTADTVVETDNGAIRIGDLAIAEPIWGADLEIDANRLQSVAVVHVGLASTVARVIIEGDALECTFEHPFFTVTRGWQPAINLRSGDLLLTMEGEFVPVLDVQVERCNPPVPVYTITAGEARTYYVGNSN